MKDDVPKGWVTIGVSDIAADEPGSLTDGPFGSNLKTSHYTDMGPRVIRLQNIGDGAFLDARAHISNEYFERLRRHEAVSGDVVIAMLGETLPRACVVPDWLGPAIVKADCVRLRVDARLAMPRYVTHSLNSPQMRTQAAALLHGVGRPRLGLKWLRQMDARLAPRLEQHRIVEAIDSYFTRLDDAEQTLERVRRNLERYRASVLTAAVEGRLVPTEAELARAEGRDYEPASVLLDRILAERRDQRAHAATYRENLLNSTLATPVSGLPGGWCSVPLGTCASLITKGSTPTSYGHEYQSSGINFIRVENLSQGRINRVSISIFIDEKADDTLKRSRLHAGDILLSIAGTIGRSAVVYADDLPANTNQALAIIRGTGGLLHSGYLQIVLDSHVGQAQARRGARGGAMSNISLADVKALTIPIPPYREQERIAAEADRLMSVIQRVSTEVATQSRKVSAVRQSILKWAFEGRLVDQDPTDEPAPELLERIAAERASSNGEDRPRRSPRGAGRASARSRSESG